MAGPFLLHYFTGDYLCFDLFVRTQVDRSPLTELGEQFNNTLDNLENNQLNPQLSSHALPMGSKSFNDILASLQVSVVGVVFFQATLKLVCFVLLFLALLDVNFESKQER